MSEVQLFYGCDGVPRKAIRLLLRFGFSRHGRTFNRRTEDGLTQVVFFNEVPEQSPDSDFIALTTAAAQKLLDVRLGVYVPEVCDLVDGRKIGDHVPFDRCTFCTTARRLIHGTYVNWDDSPLELLLLLNSVLFDHGFRFFSEYESRDRILAHLEKPGQHVGGAVVTRIACAIILAHRGEKKRAEALLWAQARENRDKDRNEYLRDLSRRLRLGEL